MIRPMIVMTTSISTSVKPASPLARAPVGRAAKRRRQTNLFMAFMSHYHPTIWLTDISAVMTETIRPPTIMLMTMIASGPDDADQPVEAALQLGFVKIGDASREHRQLAGFLAQPQGAHRHRAASARVCASASESLPPWRTLSTIWLQTVSVARRRHHVGENPQARGQRDAARQQEAEIAAEQRGPMIAQHRPTSGRRATRLDDRARARRAPQRQPEADRQQADERRRRAPARCRAGNRKGRETSPAPDRAWR